MSALAAKNLQSPADRPPSSQPSETSRLLSQNLESIALEARELSLAWKAMNEGSDSLTWRRRWKGARNSLAELQALSER